MLAAALVACCLVLVGPMLTSSQRVRPQTVVVGAALALVAMLGARYVAFAARLRSRPPAPAAVKIIVFGAGDSRGPADPPADHPVRRGLPAGGDPRRRPRQEAVADPRCSGARRPRPDGGGRRQHRRQGPGHRDRRGDRQGHQGSHRGGRALRARPEGDPVAAGTAGRPRADRRRPGSPHQRPARAPGGDLRRGLGPRTHRGPAGPGDRRGRLHRRRAVPPAAPARARAADHAGPRRVGPARGPAHAARAGPARFRGDRAGRHPRPAPGQGGLRAVPARHRVPRRGAQAPAAAGTLPRPRRSRATSWAPSRSWKPRPIMASTRSSTSRPTRPRTR